MKQLSIMTVVTALFLSAGIPEANAQSLSGGVDPIQNASAAGARSPGNMVISGIARRDDYLSPPIRTFNNITAPEVPDLLEGFRSTASVVLATQLVIAINLIVDSLVDRSGILDTLRNSATTPVPDNTGGDTGGRTPGRGKSQQ